MNPSLERKWSCEEQEDCYIITLSMFGHSVSDRILKAQFTESYYRMEMLRCSIQRLQRKMVDVILPFQCGKFRSDWEL